MGKEYNKRKPLLIGFYLATCLSSPSRQAERNSSAALFPAIFHNFVTNCSSKYFHFSTLLFTQCHKLVPPFWSIQTKSLIFCCPHYILFQITRRRNVFPEGRQTHLVHWGRVHECEGCLVKDQTFPLFSPPFPHSKIHCHLNKPNIWRHNLLVYFSHVASHICRFLCHLRHSWSCTFSLRI